jgi:hypothetical protein
MSSVYSVTHVAGQDIAATFSLREKEESYAASPSEAGADSSPSSP